MILVLVYHDFFTFGGSYHVFRVGGVAEEWISGDRLFDCRVLTEEILTGIDVVEALD